MCVRARVHFNCIAFFCLSLFRFAISFYCNEKIRKSTQNQLIVFALTCRLSLWRSTQVVTDQWATDYRHSWSQYFDWRCASAPMCGMVGGKWAPHKSCSNEDRKAKKKKLRQSSIQSICSSIFNEERRNDAEKNRQHKKAKHRQYFQITAFDYYIVDRFSALFWRKMHRWKYNRWPFETDGDDDNGNNSFATTKRSFSEQSCRFCKQDAKSKESTASEKKKYDLRWSWSCVVSDHYSYSNRSAKIQRKEGKSRINKKMIINRWLMNRSWRAVQPKRNELCFGREQKM